MTLVVNTQCPLTSTLSGFTISDVTYLIGAPDLMMTIPSPFDSSAGACGPIDITLGQGAPAFVAIVGIPP